MCVYVVPVLYTVLVTSHLCVHLSVQRHKTYVNIDAKNIYAMNFVCSVSSGITQHLYVLCFNTSTTLKCVFTI